MAYGFNDDKSKYPVTYESGDTISDGLGVDDAVYCIGYVTINQLLIFQFPLTKPVGDDAVIADTVTAATRDQGNTTFYVNAYQDGNQILLFERFNMWSDDLTITENVGGLNIIIRSNKFAAAKVKDPILLEIENYQFDVIEKR